MATLLSRFRRLTRPRPKAPARSQDYYFLGEGLGLTRLRSGRMIYVDPSEESVCAHLIAQGYWENWVEQTVRRLLRPGDHVVEIGGHVGYFTLTMADIVGPAGSVTTFEANPRLAALAARSLRFNGFADRATIHNKAVSDVAGQVRFSTSRREGGGGHLFRMDGAFGAETEDFEIESVRLDDLDLPSARLIRIDAEGSEAKILMNAARLLARPDVVLCIEWDVGQINLRSDASGFAAWLDDQGFCFWRIRHDTGLDPIPAAELVALRPCDLVVSRRDPFAIET